jgi:GR25 family glycosyltransferase involved in LPS biosynthesis
MTSSAYVISLERRADRYASFCRDTVPAILACGSPNPQVITGIDGRQLPLTDSTLRERVNPWNFRYLSDKTLRGVIGCCLSHLECYRDMIRKGVQQAWIFEDDCVPCIPGGKLPPLPQKDFGIIFLNSWGKQDDEGDIELIPWTTCKTTESYIISREYAQILYDYNYNNIGAIDAHMDKCYKLHPEFPHYELSRGIFRQRERQDSDIQITVSDRISFSSRK